MKCGAVFSDWEPVKGGTDTLAKAAAVPFRSTVVFNIIYVNDMPISRYCTTWTLLQFADDTVTCYVYVVTPRARVLASC